MWAGDSSVLIQKILDDVLSAYKGREEGEYFLKGERVSTARTAEKFCACLHPWAVPVSEVEF